jgi:hypothetical protein
MPGLTNSLLRSQSMTDLNNKKLNPGEHSTKPPQTASLLCAKIRNPRQPAGKLMRELERNPITRKINSAGRHESTSTTSLLFVTNANSTPVGRHMTPSRVDAAECPPNAPMGRECVCQAGHQHAFAKIAANCLLHSTLRAKISKPIHKWGT